MYFTVNTPLLYFEYVYSSETAGGQEKNSVPVKETCIRKYVRANFGLLYILFDTFIVLEEKKISWFI